MFGRKNDDTVYVVARDEWNTKDLVDKYQVQKQNSSGIFTHKDNLSLGEAERLARKLNQG